MVIGLISDKAWFWGGLAPSLHPDRRHAGRADGVPAAAHRPGRPLPRG
ncbi:hypothetical protein LP419_27520 [Massilia sp. H-1]|nr:hypothetical protein LP419_27520 [Massilia sp. H-1]